MEWEAHFPVSQTVFVDSLAHDLYEPTVLNRRSKVVVVLGGMVDVCCIVGKAALSEMLVNVECVGARDYSLLSPFTLGWTVSVRALGGVR